MATLRKPRKLKSPKSPKANASADTLKKHLAKVKEVEQKNKKAFADYEKEKKERISLRKKIDSAKKSK
jgi:hypothetical protein